MIIGHRIILVDSKCYHSMFINSLVSVILHHCRLALISRHYKEATNNSYTPGAIWNFVDQSINQTITLEYNGAPNIPTRFFFWIQRSGFHRRHNLQFIIERTHNEKTYWHIKQLIALKIIGYHVINEKLNPVYKLSKQWQHQKYLEPYEVISLLF
jgi:hypothetical protein